jgi:tight adherence protein C
MILLLVLGMGLAGISITLLLRAATASRTVTLRSLARLRSYGYGGVTPTGKPARAGIRLDSLAGVVGGFMTERFDRLREDELRVVLHGAGLYQLTPRKFIGYRLLAACALPLLWLWYSSGGNAGPFRIFLGVVVAASLGWRLPVFVVKRRASARLAQIDYDLPELVDLLVTTVEGGVGFSGSLQMAGRNLDGPLGQELRIARQEQNLGLSTDEALSNMLVRADTPAMRSFVRAIRQGETLGVSIGKILRDLATEMRKRRRQAAEERAQKAPTKMLFPLIFLIFPAMFLVILGPAAFELLRAFRGG